jgi:hypothetical protein
MMKRARGAMICPKCNEVVEINTMVGTDEEWKDRKEKAEMNDNDWKELDKSTPIEVIMNMDKYSIQLKNYNGQWINTEMEEGRDLFEKLVGGDIKYRYKLKPLESIRIDQQVMDDLSALFDKEMDTDILTAKYNRKVEIIEEGC